MRTIWERSSDERGTVLILALFIMAFLMVAGAFLLRMSSAETDIAYNTVFSEGAFHAADAGLFVAVDALNATVTADATVNCAALADGFSCQHQAPPANNVQFLGTTIMPGYDPTKFDFYSYTVTGTGSLTRLGVATAQRKVEARAAFGPVPK